MLSLLIDLTTRSNTNLAKPGELRGVLKLYVRLRKRVKVRFVKTGEAYDYDEVSSSSQLVWGWMAHQGAYDSRRHALENSLCISGMSL